MQAKRNRGGFDREEESALLVALLELHRAKQQRPAAIRGDSAYGRVLDHFEQRGKRLAGERLAIEQLLGRAWQQAGAMPPQVQQELVVSGALGRSAAGRFRVHNRLSRPARVELVAGEPLEGVAPALRFEPTTLDLAAGSAAWVRVVADLASVRAPFTCTVPVECRADGSRDRLWLVIEAFDPEERTR